MPSHHPKAQRTKGERRRRAKATPESNKSLQERGGDLHRLQLNRKRRLPQDGPAAAQLRWTTHSGGVFTSFTSKGPRHQGAVWRFNVIYKEQGTISIIELLAHKQKPASVQTGPWTSCGRSEFAPSSCSPLLHFREPTTIPSRPAMVYEDHRRTERV